MSARIPAGNAGDFRVSLAVTGALMASTFLLTRQTQVPAIAGLAAPWVLALLVVRLRRGPALLSLVPMLTYAVFSMLFSMGIGNEPASAFRFFVITMGTLLALHCRPAPVSAPWALLPVTLQAVAIASVALTLGAAQDPALASGVRAYVLGQEWGDVYTFDGLYYRVQVIGNALIPLLFLVCLYRRERGPVYRITMWIAVAGLCAAGNLTYFLVAGIAVLLRYGGWLRRRRWVPIAAGLLVPVLLVMAWGVLSDVVSTKFEGSSSSMGVRFDQIRVASEEMGSSVAQVLLGDGLGARFPDGREGNYSQSQYIELQSLYLVLQLGLVGAALYVLTLAREMRRFLDPTGRTILWLYLLAGFSNPYILDSNQILATILLVMLYPNRAADDGRPAPAPRPAEPLPRPA